MGTRKIGPAIAAGCTMIVKPASATPLTMLKLAEVFAEAGLPEGVLQVITSKKSRAITEALMGDARLRTISFTGSTAVEIGRASCRERECQDVEISVVAGSLKKK